MKYTELTETDISKLYRACVMDEQGSLVGFMLRNNPSLFSLRLTKPKGNESEEDDSKDYNAFEYVRFHKGSKYLPQIWEAFAAPNIEIESIESSN